MLIGFVMNLMFQLRNSIHDLFARSGANAVIVAVNIESAIAVLTETLKFKWFILTEKPVGLSVDDLNRIIEIQKKHCTPLFVALNRRHYSSTRSAFQFLRNDKSLRVVSVIDQENIMAPLKGGFQFSSIVMDVHKWCSPD